MAFGNAKPKRLTVGGSFDLQSVGKEVKYVKGSYMLFNLQSSKGRVTMSAGETAEGKGYDNISITAKALKICSDEVAALEKANELKQEGPLLKLAEAMFKFFKTKRKVKVIVPKANGKAILSDQDKLPVVNLVEIK